MLLLGVEFGFVLPFEMNDWDPARERSRARSTRPAPVTVERGCEVALADMKDAEALTAAFTGVSGVFVLIPAVSCFSQFRWCRSDRAHAGAWQCRCR